MPEFIPGCEPFRFEGGPTGALLVHGFTGTPREVRWLGEFLAERGLTVLGVRLAGHATTLADMENTTWHNWWDSVRTAYVELRGQRERVFVMGISLGGMLTLHLGAHYPDAAGLVAMSAPGKVLGAEYLRLPPERRDGALHILPTSGGKDFQDRRVLREWHVNYSHAPVRCIASLFEFSLHLHEDIPDVRAPLLLIHSQRDGVVPPENMPYIYERAASTDKDMVWAERSGHMVTEDYEKGKVFAQAYAFVQAHC